MRALIPEVARRHGLTPQPSGLTFARKRRPLVTNQADPSSGTEYRCRAQFRVWLFRDPILRERGRAGACPEPADGSWSVYQGHVAQALLIIDAGPTSGGHAAGKA